MSSMRYVGLDVHKAAITVALADDAEVRLLGTIPNEPDAVRRLVRKLGPPATLRCCYEAGPCGYEVYRVLEAAGVPCTVVAPTLIPVRPGDRVKTDRRDAAKLARLFRSGDLTAVWVPSVATEALRDLLRARRAAKQDLVRAQHRFTKLLLRQGHRPPGGYRPWSRPWHQWVQQLTYAAPALQIVHADYLASVEYQRARVAALEAALTGAVATAPAPIPTVVAGLQAVRGVGRLTAATLVLELGRFDRFRSPRPLMAYCGLVPREHSSGAHQHRGAITKTGNAHCRHVLIEAAWHARRPPTRGGHVTRRLATLPPALQPLARRASVRLHTRYRHLVGRGKTSTQAITAVGRELLGFLWALGVALETAA